MAYIHKYSTIAKGNTFEKGIILGHIKSQQKLLIHPDYKKVIPNANLRRSPLIVKMGLANAIKCIDNKKINAIVVATGLASIDSSEKFLSSILDSETSLLSPTPFINSVHNTISGEIALHTKNQGYNSTYSQGPLSFSGAILDAMILVKESYNVLLGSVDEAPPEFESEKKINKSKKNTIFDTGSSFFQITNKKDGSLAKIVDCIITKKDNLNYYLKNFDSKQDIILSGNSFIDYRIDKKEINYSKFSGIYMTNHAFGLQLSIEILNKHPEKINSHRIPKKINHIFVINYASKNDVSIIIVKK